MVTTVKVPAPFEPLFEQAEKYVAALFKEFKQEPQKGTIHVGGERYILIRGESLFVALFDQLQGAFGDEQAQEFIYNMARIIGKADSKAFAENRKLTDPNAKLSTGPVHFAFSGWAFVDIYPTSSPSPDQNYFLHYQHPNTFESEIYKRKKIKPEHPICFFSAGYSAGWCSEAYGLEVHARELSCTACGDERCEFIMAPFDKLDQFAQKYRKK
jgi:predicted hydrocarbon binding protein